jgi:hypothetical protein
MVVFGCFALSTNADAVDLGPPKPLSDMGLRVDRMYLLDSGDPNLGTFLDPEYAAARSWAQQRMIRVETVETLSSDFLSLGSSPGRRWSHGTTVILGHSTHFDISHGTGALDAIVQRELERSVSQRLVFFGCGTDELAKQYAAKHSVVAIGMGGAVTLTTAGAHRPYNPGSSYVNQYDPSGSRTRLGKLYGPGDGVRFPLSGNLVGTQNIAPVRYGRGRPSLGPPLPDLGSLSRNGPALPELLPRRPALPNLARNSIAAPLGPALPKLAPRVPFGMPMAPRFEPLQLHAEMDQTPPGMLDPNDVNGDGDDDD